MEASNLTGLLKASPKSQTSHSGLLQLSRRDKRPQFLSGLYDLLCLHAHRCLECMDSGRIDALYCGYRSRCAHRGQRFLASEQFVADAHLVHAACCGIAEACVSEGLDSSRITGVVVFHMRHLMLSFERYISRIPSCQYFRTKAMHHMHPIRGCECGSIVSPSCRYHSPSLCPLSKVTLDRAVIIDFNAAHDHSVIVLLDVRARLPGAATPCIGLPPPPDQSSVEPSSNHAIGAICAGGANLCMHGRRLGA